VLVLLSLVETTVEDVGRAVAPVVVLVVVLVVVVGSGRASSLLPDAHAAVVHTAVSINAAALMIAHFARPTAATLALRRNRPNAARAGTDKLFSRTRHVR
jgi:threonine/homoserine efflux transporter RhtA